jgi:L-fuculose-phosphate aldolase
MSTELEIRQQIVDIGHRMWSRCLCAGNEGNISVRIAENEVLCTPTLVSKGFMKPEEICKVDLNGNQLSGPRKRTSEVLLHLEIYKARPELAAVVHSHAPYLSAFAIARRNIPACYTAEMASTIGEIPFADYAKPGTPQVARSILQFVDQAKAVLLANHGVVCWAKTLEEAYFIMEVAESYCKMLLLADRLGGGQALKPDEIKELLQ